MARFATEQEAAKAFSLELATFRHLVACGRLPGPVPEIGLHDLKALDAAFDQLSGIGSPTNALDRWRGLRRAG